MSNITTKQLLSRKSIRAFTNDNVKKEDLELILECARMAPTSINGQQITMIYTQDKEKIKKISELCGGQPQVAAANVFVTFVMDFNRTNEAVESLGQKQVVEQSAESILVGSIDAGIMLNALQISAESLGYGTTAIGGVRSNPQAMIDFLGLPKRTFPLVGTTIGVPEEKAKNAPLKPRIPLNTLAFKDKYDANKVKEGVLQYEKDMKAFREKNGMNYGMSYKELVASYYTKFYHKVAGVLKSQGFDFRDE